VLLSLNIVIEFTFLIFYGSLSLRQFLPVVLHLSCMVCVVITCCESHLSPISLQQVDLQIFHLYTLDCWWSSVCSGFFLWGVVFVFTTLEHRLGCIVCFIFILVFSPTNFYMFLFLFIMMLNNTFESVVYCSFHIDLFRAALQIFRVCLHFFLCALLLLHPLCLLLSHTCDYSLIHVGHIFILFD
jgi:hypothetical protein